ncbi:MAG: flavin reductase family protein [Oceanicaulis sp.]|uniref:flavin reductase family protein n=1 Tax=Glycocaulis sp. TaxID=1969725 RepID=UPI0025BC4055|nr:flavin reductase family protein [Glycocaulis sp.]MCC5980267.1 flavin reductase family protein [Oceanicaulis sp.]MCH8521110.1 flavin reductase family protein [Glycocaulis sp.]
MDKARAFRDALACYPTGVAIVTVRDDNAARALTINSFASVSLDPPLVLWSLDRASERYAQFAHADHFAINVLAADQEALAMACARLDNLEDAGGRWTAGQTGAALIDGALSRFECALQAVHEGGDHIIIVGRVLAFDQPRHDAALVFHRSVFANTGS